MRLRCITSSCFSLVNSNQPLGQQSNSRSAKHEQYAYAISRSVLGCGHCKHLAPAYEEVGKAFDSVDSVLIAKVDADSERDLGSRFGVRGFPTLKFFPKGSTDPEE